MISKKMMHFVENSSAIRAMFEDGKRLAEIHGADNVYDFSLGNPSVEPPKAIHDAIADILNNEPANLIHGYMNNSGYKDVRDIVADSLNRKYHTHYTDEHLIMTVGAAGGLNVILKTLLNPDDEVIVMAPYFVEYNNYITNYMGKPVVVSPDYEHFQINMTDLEQKITPMTKALIVNNPNNPTGAVYSADSIQKLTSLLERKQTEYNHPIYLISDEPYREIVYDGVQVPYLPNYYDNVIVGYSFSKSLSLPGERIGYLAFSENLQDLKNILAAANVANRILGYVNAPSLFQRVIAKCIDEEVDMTVYEKNKSFLYSELSRIGYDCVKPQGAFYLFIKTLEEDDKAFCERAKEFRLLISPGSAFACPGYARIAYCTSYEKIQKSIQAFEALAKTYQEEA